MKILLVEDNNSVRKSIGEFLTEHGYEIFPVKNGAAGWQTILKTPIDIVLSDIRMPEMDGFELLSNIKQHDLHRDIPVVLFTGHGDVKDAVQAMRKGAYDYLLKPVNVAELVAIIKRLEEYIDLKNQNKKLTEAFDEEVKNATIEVRHRLEDTQKALAEAVGVSGIGVFSDALNKVFKDAKILHKNPDIPVLIEGETGTGKELVAKYIHYGEGNVVTPFIPLNCAAISSTLFESELFGYEAGAFTGGNPKGQKGKLELTQNGSIFLDEITEMAFEHQAKLLRVLQEREFFRIGGLKKMKTEARFICATNQAVEKRVNEGYFRQDLFFRLNVGFLRIPPLRERKDEILPLAYLFLKELRQKKNTRFQFINQEAESLLVNYDWPGNVRELKNTIERIVLYWNDETISSSHLKFLLNPQEKLSVRESITTIDDMQLPAERLELNSFILKLVDQALKMHNYNQTHTAKYLGISLRVLHTYLKKLKTSFD